MHALYDDTHPPAVAAPQAVVGVLAMQGAYREHVAALRAVGAAACEVRTAAELARVDGIVLPGGESTTMRKVLARSDLYDALAERLRDGLPAFGTCAGLILLATAPPDGAPDCYGVLDVEIERNGFGRQPYSFEAPVVLDAGVPEPSRARAREVNGVFIRAPRIRRVGPTVEVIARLGVGKDGEPAAPAGEPVAVRQGVLLGCTYHPELTGDTELHRLFVSICADVRAASYEGATVGGS